MTPACLTYVYNEGIHELTFMDTRNPSVGRGGLDNLRLSELQIYRYNKDTISRMLNRPGS